MPFKFHRKFFLLSILFVVIANRSLYSQKDFTQYIDPTIGNVSKFLVPTYPTMHLPNQMLRMFPDKVDYISDQVNSFPMQVHSHRRTGLFKIKVKEGNITASSWNSKMAIDHDLEDIKPWLYSTYLIDDDITVSFTPHKKSAIYKFEFNNDKQLKNILITGSSNLKANQLKKGGFSFKEKVSYTTRGTEPITREMYVYVFAKFVDENDHEIDLSHLKLNDGRLLFSFKNKKVFLKYAVSYINVDKARDNFKKELAKNSFEDLIINGKQTWKEVINQIQVKGGTSTQLRTFYTSLYRTYERMVDINEYGEYYSGYDQKVHKSKRAFYVDDWIWDTYRAQHPLRTILSPKIENDILNSYVEMYKQSGWLPTFPQVHGNHMCMNAYHSSAIFIDGYRKGLRDYDVKNAYEGIKKNLTQGTLIPWRQGLPKVALDNFYHKEGYFPSLAIGETEKVSLVDSFEKRQPVPVTLGMSYDFWTLSEFASELGKEQESKAYKKVAEGYKKLWHPDKLLFIPKDSQGKWLDIDPKSSGGRGYREYYDENNGWTYAWDVQHDIEGLIQLLGGKKNAEKRLDQLFREPLGKRKSQFFIDGSNSTGMVGQFSMGNEPSFHIPYLYNYFGAPWKTQKKTRFLLDVWFQDDIHGIPGDEDGGGMSAFVVFTSLGLYPVTPGIPVYNITSPVFEKSSINLKNGKTFTVVAKGASKRRKYIQKAFLNGKEIFTPFIHNKEIIKGGILELILDEKPNKKWGIIK
ncbi:GH92 family glycosyl hydrolase [Ochrovirga pacifica]|uniref:GH92 family glycosyl hydrolase n=1 Tax=Ochrovirga pacifica TaxID=1042376 RepID=UPI000255A545|nr:GH92 family glycosyl hydrolase [Ochrovirga pacifica]